MMIGSIVGIIFATIYRERLKNWYYAIEAIMGMFVVVKFLY